MKRKTLFAALASALSLAACAHGTDRQSQSNTKTDVNPASSAASGMSASSSQDGTSRIPAAKGTSGDTSTGSTESQGSASSGDDSRRLPAAKGESEDTPAAR
jgi:hypothetical protein